MTRILDSLLVDGVKVLGNSATVVMNKNITVVANYVIGMSLVVKNGTSADKKISVASITEYTVPAGGSTTIAVKSGDVITLE
jgi:hypothetical protein